MEEKKSNSWINHVVEYSKKNNVPYREAMSLAKDSYVKKESKSKKKPKTPKPVKEETKEEKNKISEKPERKTRMKKDIILTLTQEEAAEGKKDRENGIYRFAARSGRVGSTNV